MSVPAPPDRDSRVQVAWPELGYWARATVVIVLAVGLDPAVRFLERRGLSRGLATAIIFVSSTIAFAVFLWFAIPEFVDQVRTFARDLPGLIDDLAARDDWIGEAVRNADVKTHLQDIVADAPSRVARSFGSILGVTSRITSMLFRLLTVAILTIYFVLSYPAARRTLVRRAPVSDQVRLERVVTTITARIGGTSRGRSSKPASPPWSRRSHSSRWASASGSRSRPGPASRA